MSDHRDALMSEEALDRHLRAFLASEAADVADAPTATEMVLRVGRRVQARSDGPGRGLASGRGLRTAVLLGLLALALGILALIAGQQRTDIQRLLGNGKIFIERQAYSLDKGYLFDQLCSSCGYMHVPSWSADGTRLAYVGDDGIAIHDTRSGAVDKLGVCRDCDTVDPSNISLAADASQVAYAEDGQIRLIDASTHAVRQLTHLPAGAVANGPTLSPDGRQVAFVITGEPGLWIVGTDGGPVRQVVTDDDVHAPAWSPDGSTIAYVRGAQGLTLWLYDVAAGTHWSIWSNPDCCMGGSGLGGPGWSPDGTQIAVVGSDPTHRGSLWAVDVADGQPHKVAVGAQHYRPAWRPVPVEPQASGSDDPST
jgi:Tol biopolymer transport system component